MKRALAERAKQSGLPNGVGMPGSAMQEKSAPSSVAPTPNGPLSSASVPASGEISSNTANRTSATPQRPVLPKPQNSLSSQPLQKIDKIQVKKPTATPRTKTAARSPRAPSASSSPRPKKRARESSVKLEEEAAGELQLPVRRHQDVHESTEQYARRMQANAKAH